jgi:hypothetical protein
MNDDSLSPVYNLRGCEFKELNENNIKFPYTDLYNDNKEIVYINKDEFIFNGNYLDNTLGVFKNPTISSDAVIQDYEKKETRPWYYKISFSENLISELKKLKVKGAFIVRQKRIPTTLGQGLSIGVDSTSFIPMLYDDSKKSYISEGFLSSNKLLLESYLGREITSNKKQTSGLLCLDACVSPMMQSMLDGSDFTLHKIYQNGSLKRNGDRRFNVSFNNDIVDDRFYKTQAIFVNSDVPAKVVNNLCFSTRAGSAEDIKQFGFFGGRNYDKTSNSYVRGIYCPFIGLSSILEDNSIYDIKQKGFSNSYLKEYFKVRGYDQSPFYAISDRYSLDELDNIDVYRGDCFTNTVTIRMNRNFVDSSVPINEIIIDSTT